jgi:hypothetical protein
MSKKTTNLVAISGKMGSGKDTVGAILRVISAESYLNSNEIAKIIANPFLLSNYKYQEDNTWQIKKFAKKLKQTASILTGIPEEKFEDQEFKLTNLPTCWNQNGEAMTVRTLLQKVGTECMRDNLHINTWANALFADYNKDDKWLITDVRFTNEALEVKKRGGLIIRVDRKLDTGNHPSETELDDYTFDYVIPNKKTLQDLIKEVKKFAIFYGFV